MEHAADGFDPDEWAAELRQQRAAKDEFLGDHPRSPIPADARDDFEGLDYYPPDPEYRYVVDLQVFDDHDALTVETTQDGEQTSLRWGAFQFEVDGRQCSLTAYRQDPDEDRLWVPFRDETSGETTYGAGRYLDLEAADRTADGRWILDFNHAYSPFCAFNDAYECPLVPIENHLDVRIEAGEKYDA